MLAPLLLICTPKQKSLETTLAVSTRCALSLPVCQCEKWKVIEDSTSRERCLCPSDPGYGDKKPGCRGQRRYLQVLTLLVTAGWGESGNNNYMMASSMAAFDFGQYDKENDKPVRRGATCL